MINKYKKINFNKIKMFKIFTFIKIIAIQESDKVIKMKVNHLRLIDKFKILFKNILIQD